MDVTPHELRDLEITDAFRGYNRDEVNDLLARAATTIEDQAKTIEILTERVGTAVAETGRTRDNDDILQRTLLLAQRAADEAVREANETAQSTIAAANAQAEELLTGAREELRELHDVERARLEREILDLAARRDTLIDDVQSLEAWDDEYRNRLVHQIESDLSAAKRRPEVRAAVQPTLGQVDLGDLGAAAPSASDRQAAAPTIEAPTQDVPVVSDADGWDAVAPVIVEAAVSKAKVDPAPEGIARPLVGSAVTATPTTATSDDADAEPIEAILERPTRAARRSAKTSSEPVEAIAATEARSSYLDEVLSAPAPRQSPDIDLRAAEADRATLDDDAFFATLRDAVRDDAPLGPSTAELAAIQDDRDPSFREMFKRRR